MIEGDCIHMSWQVEMADEQNFVQFGRMGHSGLLRRGETTVLILRLE